jgi:hypothetical protein
MTQAIPSQDELSGGPLEALVAWKLRWMRPVFAILCAAVGVAVALSAMYVGTLAVRADDTLVALFELVVILAGTFVALVSIGRFREGAGLALASCALAIGGGAVLSDPGLVSRYFSTRMDPLVLDGIDVRWIMAVRVGCAVVISIGAAVRVWSRRPRESAWFLVRAMVLGVPLLVILAAAASPAIRSWAQGLPTMVRAAGVVIGFFVGLGLASAAGHCLIRSLEMGRLDDDGNPSAGPTQSPQPVA